jgi:hypothetical protein
LAERITLLPKVSQAMIKKSSSFKSALTVYTQVVKTIASKDAVLVFFHIFEVESDF